MHKKRGKNENYMYLNYSSFGYNTKRAVHRTIWILLYPNYLKIERTFKLRMSNISLCEPQPTWTDKPFILWWFSGEPRANKCGLCYHPFPLLSCKRATLLRRQTKLETTLATLAHNLTPQTPLCKSLQKLTRTANISDERHSVNPHYKRYLLIKTNIKTCTFQQKPPLAPNDLTQV